MRLYEFTDPQRYLLSEIHAADFLKQSENIKADGTADTVRLLKKKPQTKNPKDIL